MTALLPGSSSAGALPPGKAGGAMVTGGVSMLAKRSAAGGYAAGVRDGAKKGMGKEPIWSSGTTGEGEYISVADRKAIFRKQKINAAKFVGRSASTVGGAMVASGRGALSVGSAIVPRAGGLQAPDTSNVEPQSSKIEQLSAEIKALGENVKANAKKITLLKNVVKSHLKRFADFLKNDSDTKKKELLEQQKAEAKALEEGQRDAAEEGLEAPNKMKKTLLQPVQMLGKKVGGILQKLKDAFLVLFAGWMTNRGFDAIKAFMDGDKEKLTEIRNNVLGALGVVGGVFLLLSGGLLALPGIIASVVGVIASVGGAILGFLLSPPGLITLAIAAGVGTLLLGVKKLWNWVDDKATGGDEIKAKHKELDQRLKDAGISMTGKDMGSKNKRGRSTKSLTEEQKKIFEEVEEGRAKLHELKNQMNAEIENVPNEVPESGTKTTGKGRNKKTITFHTEDDKKLIKQKQDDIRARYNALISGKPQKQVSTTSSTSTSQSVSASATDSNVSKVTPTTTPGPMADAPPNVVMKKAAAPASPAAPQGSSGSPTTSVPSIPSSDPDNFYVMYSKMHYNVVT